MTGDDSTSDDAGAAQRLATQAIALARAGTVTDAAVTVLVGFAHGRGTASAWPGHAASPPPTRTPLTSRPAGAPISSPARCVA